MLDGIRIVYQMRIFSQPLYQKRQFSSMRSPHQSLRKEKHGLFAEHSLVRIQRQRKLSICATAKTPIRRTSFLICTLMELAGIRWSCTSGKNGASLPNEAFPQGYIALKLIDRRPIMCQMLEIPAGS